MRCQDGLTRAAIVESTTGWVCRAKFANELGKLTFRAGACQNRGMNQDGKANGNPGATNHTRRSRKKSLKEWEDSFVDSLVRLRRFIEASAERVIAVSKDESPEWADALRERFSEVYRGLVTKLVIDCAEADWQWGVEELELAKVMIQQLWGVTHRRKNLTARVTELASSASQINWRQLTTLFCQYPVLKESQRELLDLLTAVAKVVCMVDGDLRADEQYRIKWIANEIQSYFSPRQYSSEEAAIKVVDPPLTEEESGVAPLTARSPRGAKTLPDSSPPALKNQDAGSELEDPMQELEAMVGLKNIKQEVKQLANFLKFEEERERQGLPKSEITLHMVFCGNPGTGKTTVARILGKILKNLSILKKGHLIETDRAGFVAGYAGQTSQKSHQLIDAALDGILFIDEAYSLFAEDGNDAYGAEALQVLLKRSEDDRKRLVVILAGYPEEMTRLLRSNPGLSSRFHHRFDFPDYAVEELGQIFESLCTARQYVIPPHLRLKLILGFEMLLKDRDEHFGNGRLIRNLFEQSLRRMASRVLKEKVLTKESLTTLQSSDVQFPEIPDEVFAAHLDDEITLRIRCPHCGQESRFLSVQLGREGKCPKCGQGLLLAWGHRWSHETTDKSSDRVTKKDAPASGRGPSPGHQG